MKIEGHEVEKTDEAGTKDRTTLEPSHGQDRLPWELGLIKEEHREKKATNDDHHNHTRSLPSFRGRGSKTKREKDKGKRSRNEDETDKVHFKTGFTDSDPNTTGDYELEVISPSEVETYTLMGGREYLIFNCLAALCCAHMRAMMMGHRATGTRIAN